MYPIRQYKQELEKIIQFGGSRNESSIRRAFAALLNHYAAAQNLILVEELSVKTTKGNSIRFDEVLKDILRSDCFFKESKPSDATIRELFNGYKFADYKAQVVDLLMRVCAVSVGTMAVVSEME